MHKPLQTLAEIRSGYTFRGRIAYDPEGELRVLQIKDIKGRRDLRADVLPRIRWSASGAPPLLAGEEIVLPSKGEYREAAMIECTEPVVATSQLFVIRPHSKAIAPAFLCWYLNQPVAQNYFRANRAGTNIPMLSIQALGNLPVSIPSIRTQRKITELQNLWEEEKRVNARLMHNREKMLSGMMQKLLER